MACWMEHTSVWGGGGGELNGEHHLAKWLLPLTLALMLKFPWPWRQR